MTPTLSANLEAIIKDMTFTPITAGLSGAGVWRLSNAQGATYFLKISASETSDEGRAEYEKLVWVSSRYPAPRIIHVEETDDAFYLLTEALRGVTLDELPENSSTNTILAQNVGDALHQLHSLPIADCPFDMRLDHRFALAEQRVREGHVDADDFDENRTGMDAADLFAEAVTTRPDREDLVFTHGDFTPANILVDTDSLQVTGLIDWGRVGIADRHQDIALILRDLAPALHRPFLEAYGHSLEQALIDYYQLMDEFF